MNFKRSATLLLVGLMAISMIAPPAMAQSAALNDFNEDAPAAQNPYISADVTVDAYDRSEMQPGEYEADNGDIEKLPATVDKSDDVDDLGSGDVNAYHFVASDIDFSDGSAFPHAESSVSAVDNVTEWSTTGSMTVADSSTAPGVEALEVSTSGQTSGDTAVATFDNVSITSDAEKKYLQVVADVNSLDSGATVEIRAVDADGDYVDLRAAASASASDDDVMATGTGEGVVDQEQVGALTVEGTGDGTMAEIQSVEVAVSGGDADIDIAALNADKSSEWAFGDERVNTDSSDDFETETVRDHTGGEIMISDLSTLGSEFDDATINGLTMPMDFAAADLAAEDTRVNVTFSEASEYPSFANKQTARYRLTLPSAYDLSYANAELRQESNIPESRYQAVEVVEGASDTNFSDLSGWTDISDQIGSSGDDAVLDDTIQPGQEIAYRSVTLLTGDERSTIEAVGGGSGGIVDTILSPFGALAGAVGALLARIRGAI